MTPVTDESLALACNTIADLETLIDAEYETLEGQHALQSSVLIWDRIAPRLCRLIRLQRDALAWLDIALARGETRRPFEAPDVL